MILFFGLSFLAKSIGFNRAADMQTVLAQAPRSLSNSFASSFTWTWQLGDAKPGLARALDKLFKMPKGFVSAMVRRPRCQHLS